jgi:polysaccharide pyruvyl transferase WcaK-like protein
VDQLETAAARDLFQRAFLPVRSWTVRSESCQRALLDLGANPAKVTVGADWAWLYRARRDLRGWAAGRLREAGVDPVAPLLLANVVNMIWTDASDARRAIAAAFDELSARHGFQICFFSNECRDGEFFDFAAASQIRDLMSRPAVLFPNHYYSPDEVLGLLSLATVAVAQRYHFAIESAMAGCVPVCLVRGQKMRGLVEELDLPAPGTIDRVDSQQLLEAVLQAAAGREAEVVRLRTLAARLRDRARRNLEFLRRDFPDWEAVRYSL